MKPPPGQLSLFELDARGEPLVHQAGPRATPLAKSPELPAPRTLANHDESRRLGTDGTGEDPLALLAGYLTQLAAAPAPAARMATEVDLRQARDDWLRRLQTSRRSKSTLTAYRVAIDDLLDWSSDHGRNVFEEATIVDHLAAYQRRAQPAPATYSRRFGLLRRFLHWLSRRSGLPDPFLELEPPPKPQQEADWLTEDEFARLLAAAEHPRRCRKGLAERDRLVLLALVETSLRRSELIALNWCEVDLESGRPSLLVRQGKGAKPRRQPLAPQLAEELQQLRDEQSRGPSDLHIRRARVGRVERGDRHRRVIDNRGLEAGRAARCLTAVRRNASAAATALAGQRCRHHQVDGDPARREPATGLRVGEVAVEASALHRLLEQRVVGQRTRVDGQIGVLGRLAERYRHGTGVEVNGLGADQHERVALSDERLQRVEQRRACGDERLSVARPVHCSPSSRAARLLRSGCGQDR
jgi:integrase